MKISIKLIENNDEIIANCPELDINCYAFSRDEAVRRIKSVISFYVESAKELGFDVESLEHISVEGKEDRLDPVENLQPSQLIN